MSFVPRLSEEDWARIEGLLADAERRPAPPSADRIGQLLAALDRLRGSVDTPFVEAVAVIGQLLEVWDMACVISRRVASPIEPLLFDLVCHEVVTAYEINASCHDVRIELMNLRQDLNGTP